MKTIEHPISGAEPRNWMLVVGCRMLDVPKSALIFAIHIYRWTISPAQVFLFGASAGCRFTPTCSLYALDAVRAHGAMAGTVLATKRICRCHPWGGCGHDPVPKAEDGKRKSGNFLGCAQSSHS